MFLNTLIRWVVLIGVTEFLLACGGGTAAPQAIGPSPTVAALELPTQEVVTTIATDRPEPTATSRPTARPTATVELTVAQCLSTFCPPPWLDQKARPVADEPGIIAANALDELHIYLIYDASALSEEEAISLFETVSGLPVLDDQQ